MISGSEWPFQSGNGTLRQQWGTFGVKSWGSLMSLYWVEGLKGPTGSNGALCRCLLRPPNGQKLGVCDTPPPPHTPPSARPWSGPGISRILGFRCFFILVNNTYIWYLLKFLKLQQTLSDIFLNFSNSNKWTLNLKIPHLSPILIFIFLFPLLTNHSHSSSP